MKTILYNPIFINPQAYYVFPQLYDIEKGDSFIESAVYSGYLIIEDLISNTSSQVINTKEVDFTEFAGKRIRISQYTNLGAVVLGEWLLPEGEPSGPSFHQSLVDAWFMSGPSNSDKPSSITGVNGIKMELKNFAYTAGSGFGMYNTSFKGWRKVSSSADYIIADTYVKVTTHYEAEGNRPIVGIAAEDYNNVTFKVRAEFTDYSYTPSNTDGVRLSLIYVDNMGSTIAAGENVITPGLNTVYKFDLSSVPEEYLSTALVAIIVRGKGTIRMDIEREEGALVFDGVDDYGICTGLPILDDYTVICRREIISIKNSSAVASKRTYPDDVGSFGAFILERVFASGGKSIYSFGSPNGISEFDSNEVVYQTKTSYNGITITSGNDNDSDTLCLGANAYNITLERCQEFSNVAIYYFALYNKSLTPEEIEEEKTRLNEEWLKRKTE